MFHPNTLKESKKQRAEAEIDSNFNNWLEKSMVPNDWLVANVIPPFNEGNGQRPQLQTSQLKIIVRKK